MNWSHGYYVSNTYTHGFYREMAPNWIDFAALVQGHNSPRAGEGDHFRYLDLGFGTGFGLCMLASLYPEGEFIGVDFLPDHVAHARWIAAQLELSNVRFIGADFVDLANDPSPLLKAVDGHAYHYIAAHGIITWVTEPIRQALLSLTKSCLEYGGIFYCSYNTYPGWLSRTIFHQLIELQTNRSDPADTGSPYAFVAEKVHSLMADELNILPLRHVYPDLKEHANHFQSQHVSYLGHEYANAGWQPLYVGQMHQLARSHQLSYIGTATLNEMFTDLYPANLQSALAGESNRTMRETIIDIAINKAFRRDLFIKGTVPQTVSTLTESIGKVQLRAYSASSIQQTEFNTNYGVVKISELNTTVRQSVGKLLTTKSVSIAELSRSCDINIGELLRFASLLMDANRIGIDRGSSGEAATPACQALNQKILELMLEDYGYSHMAAPRIGIGIRFTAIEAILIHGILGGIEEDSLKLYLHAGMVQKAIPFHDDNQQPIQSETDKVMRVSQLVDDFLAQRLPELKFIGCI